MIPNRFAPFLFGFIMSGLMSWFVSGVAISRNAGFGDGLMQLWLNAWPSTWLIAFPTVLVVAPIARRIVSRVVG